MAKIEKKINQDELRASIIAAILKKEGEFTHADIEAMAQALAGEIKSGNIDVSTAKASHEAQRRINLAAFARENDNTDGFSAFMEVVFGFKLLPHARKWIDKIYEDHAKGEGTVIMAHRDSAKTTTVTVGFNIFRLGHDAPRTNLLLMLNEQVSEKNAKASMSIIEKNSGWNLTFPNMVPDKKRGWSVKTGYYLRDLDDPDWDQKITAFNDPQYFSVGIKTTAIGSRPTGTFMVDDIHDKSNIKGTPLADTMERLQSTFMPMLTKMVDDDGGESYKTWKFAIGTPWVKDDALDWLSKLPGWNIIKTPVLEMIVGPTPKWVPCGEEHRNATWNEDIDGYVSPEYPAGFSVHFPEGLDYLHKPLYWSRYDSWIIPNWPEKFDIAYLEEKWHEAGGEIEFARMYLLDLEAIKGKYLQSGWLFPYPLASIFNDWPVVMGVDYASSIDFIKPGGKPDKTAIAIGRLLPNMAGTVLIDGFEGKLSRGEAENKINQIADIYQPIAIGVENVGAGIELVGDLLLKSAWNIVPCHPGKKSKGIRFEDGLAPLFQFRAAWYADNGSEFIELFKTQWEEYPFGAHDDVLDSVYWMLNVAAPYVQASYKLLFDENNQMMMGRRNKPRKMNPFKNL